MKTDRDRRAGGGPGSTSGGVESGKVSPPGFVQRLWVPLVLLVKLIDVIQIGSVKEIETLHRGFRSRLSLNDRRQPFDLF
jgi:hypothetical protein